MDNEYRVTVKKIIDMSVYVTTKNAENAKELAMQRIVNEDETFFYEEVEYTQPRAYQIKGE